MSKKKKKKSYPFFSLFSFFSLSRKKKKKTDKEQVGASQKVQPKEPTLLPKIQAYFADFP